MSQGGEGLHKSWRVSSQQAKGFSQSQGALAPPEHS